MEVGGLATHDATFAYKNGDNRSPTNSLKLWVVRFVNVRSRRTRKVSGLCGPPTQIARTMLGYALDNRCNPLRSLAGGLARISPPGRFHPHPRRTRRHLRGHRDHQARLISTSGGCLGCSNPRKSSETTNPCLPTPVLVEEPARLVPFPSHGFTGFQRWSRQRNCPSRADST